MSYGFIAAAVRQWAAVEEGGLNPLQVRELLKALDAEDGKQLCRDEADRESVRVALASAFYHASDEARAVREMLIHEDSNAEERRVLEHGLQQTELRRMRYSQLHDRLLAAVPPTTPPGAEPISRHPLANGSGDWKGAPIG